jgi:RNA polymerase sigma factor (sigma-70 family)
VGTNQDYQNFTDAALVDAYMQTANKELIGVLFKRYSHMVFGVCMKYLRDENESKDATMQIFEKLLMDLQKHEIGSFKPWLYTVTKNHCFMKLRTKPKEISGFESDLMEKEAFLHLPTEAPDAVVDKELQLQKLEKAILKLEENQQKCIELFYLKQYSYQQITELTTYNLNQVKSYIQNGKRNLKNLLESDE